MHITNFRSAFHPVWIDRFVEKITNLESKISLIAISSLAFFALAYIAYKRWFQPVVIEKQTTRPEEPPKLPLDEAIHSDKQKKEDTAVEAIEDGASEETVIDETHYEPTEDQPLEVTKDDAKDESIEELQDATEQTTELKEPETIKQKAQSVLSELSIVDQTPVKAPLPSSVKSSPNTSQRIQLLHQQLFAKKQEEILPVKKRDLSNDVQIQIAKKQEQIQPVKKRDLSNDVQIQIAKKQEQIQPVKKRVLSDDIWIQTLKNRTQRKHNLPPTTVHPDIPNKKE